MLMLRKKGTTEPMWPFHQVLAMRTDIESFDDGRAEPSLTKVIEVARAGEPQPTGLKVAIQANSAPALDVAAVTDRTELRKICLEHGIKVAGNPSVATLQALLQKHFAKGSG